uniref:Uncharacterized protein n=1 Tax=Photinus pyralis TaxID=7054 RepID=A0A1Y1M7K0_PHOPY
MNRIHHWRRVAEQQQAKLFIKAKKLRKLQPKSTPSLLQPKSTYPFFASALNRKDHYQAVYRLNTIYMHGAAVEATCTAQMRPLNTFYMQMRDCCRGQRLNDLAGDNLKLHKIGELNLKAIISFFNWLKRVRAAQTSLEVLKDYTALPHNKYTGGYIS